MGDPSPALMGHRGQDRHAQKPAAWQPLPVRRHAAFSSGSAPCSDEAESQAWLFPETHCQAGGRSCNAQELFTIISKKWASATSEIWAYTGDREDDQGWLRVTAKGGARCASERRGQVATARQVRGPRGHLPRSPASRPRPCVWPLSFHWGTKAVSQDGAVPPHLHRHVCLGHWGGLHCEPQEQLRNPLFELKLSVGDSQIMRVEQGFFWAVVSLFPVTRPFWCKE